MFKKTGFTDSFSLPFMGLLGILFLFSCNPDKKTEQKKISNLSIKWERRTDSLLRDTVKVNQAVDSLKKQITEAPDDTTAINLVNILSQEWKNEPNFILATEALEKSRLLDFKFGEIDALSRLGYYYYWIDDYGAADSALKLSFNLATKFNIKKLQVQALIAWGKVTRIKGDYTQALIYFRQGMNIATKIGDKNQSAMCLNSIGEVYRLEGDNFEALHYYQQSLAISKQTGDKNRIASALSSIGDVYRLQDDYSKSLNYFQQAINIAKQTGDKSMLAFCYDNMGEIYRVQTDFEKGIEYLLKSFEIAEELHDKTRISSCLSSLGNAYASLGKHAKALDYYQQTIAMATEIGDKVKIAGAINGIGEIYLLKKENKKAQEQYLQSLKIGRELEEKSLVAECLRSLGYASLNINDLAGAKKYADEGFLVAKECNTPGTIEGAAELSYRVYDKTNDYKKAYEMHNLWIEMKDSITNKESMKKFASQEYKAKEEDMKTEQLKKDITYKAEKIQKEAELHRQKLLRNGFIIGAILLCGLVFFVYRNLQQSKKAHKIITEQKRQVEIQKAITEEQKKLIEEKQKEIVDSINYAKNIQQNLFPTEIYIEKTLKRLMRKS
jgi:tetratricopeptide (TPR) repeat protein